MVVFVSGHRVPQMRGIDLRAIHVVCEQADNKADVVPCDRLRAKQRFHDKYRSAKEVKNNYLSDLSSQTAKKKNAELADLGLPRLPQLKDEFLELCEELEV